MFESAIVDALMKVAAVGGLAGLVGSYVGSVRANLFGAALVGVIGGISAAGLLKILGVDPIASAGEGFSYLWSALGGLMLGYVISRSSR